MTLQFGLFASQVAEASIVGTGACKSLEARSRTSLLCLQATERAGASGLSWHCSRLFSRYIGIGNCQVARTSSRLENRSLMKYGSLSATRFGFLIGGSCKGIFEALSTGPHS